jgi:hypothetical protein
LAKAESSRSGIFRASGRRTVTSVPRPAPALHQGKADAEALGPSARALLGVGATLRKLFDADQLLDAVRKVMQPRV